MKCIRVEKFLPLYVAGDLAERRGRAVEHHLATCEKCRRAAAAYRASRDMFCPSTLAPEFEGAFYDEIRHSVLAEIRGDRRTLAPLTGFARLFNPRLAYAASLFLVIIAAALALHSHRRLTSEDGAAESALATVGGARSAAARPTSKTPLPTAPGSAERITSRVRGARSREKRANDSSLPVSGANLRLTRNAPPPRPNLTSRTPSTDGRDTSALNVAPESANAAELNAGQGHDGGTSAQPEVSRIEIQTSDPNIRIIWLSPKAENAVHPLK